MGQVLGHSLWVEASLGLPVRPLASLQTKEERPNDNKMTQRKSDVALSQKLAEVCGKGENFLFSLSFFWLF